MFELIQIRLFKSADAALCIVDCGCAMADDRAKPVVPTDQFHAVVLRNMQNNVHPQPPSAQPVHDHLVPVNNSTTRFFSSIAARYPDLRGSLLVAGIEQDFLANPRQRLTRVQFFSSTGVKLLLRDNESNNRRQDVVVSDYARRILAEEMMVYFRGVPPARKAGGTPVEGCVMNERASAKHT